MHLEWMAQSLRINIYNLKPCPVLTLEKPVSVKFLLIIADTGFSFLPGTKRQGFRSFIIEGEQIFVVSYADKDWL